MNWLQYYTLRHKVRHSIWVFPVFGALAAIVIVRLLHWVEDTRGWVSPIDPDTAKQGLQVQFTVEDPEVFTTPWSGLVTYRRLIGAWPESVCAEHPQFLGTEVAAPTAVTPDF